MVVAIGRVLRQSVKRRKSTFLAGVGLGGGFGTAISGQFWVAVVFFSLSVLVLGVAAFRSWLTATRGSDFLRSRKRATTFSVAKDKTVAEVREAENPILVIEASWGSSACKSLDCWQEVFEDLKDRAPEALGRIIDRRDSISIIELRFLAELVHLERRYWPSNTEVETVIGLALESRALAPWTNSSVGNRLIQVLLKTPGTPFLRESLPVVWSSLPGTTKSKVLRSLAFDRDVSEYQVWRAQYEPESEIQRLRTEALDGYALKGGEHVYRDFRRKVLESNTAVGRVYKFHIAPLEEKLPEKRNFLHSGWLSPGENPLFLSLRRALEAKTPMSFVRVGDGESYGFDNNPFLFDGRGRDRQEEHWWGQSYEASVRSREIASFRLAIQQADFLGIPTVGRLVRNGFHDYRPNSSSARTIHVTTEALRSAEKVPGQIIVDEWSKHDLMIPDLFSRLIDAAIACVVISGYRREPMEPVFQGAACPVTFLELPAHAKQRGTHFASEVRGTTLQSIDEISVALASGLAQPGVLVLISAGFGGKKLVSRAAASGAVAVDVGHALLRMAARRGA